MDNPFEESQSNDIIGSTGFGNELNIVLWKEAKGRKTNTYIRGWNIDELELKQYLKDFKKTHGCNGSIKNESGLIVHLQGDKIDEITEFIISKGIKKENISLKGQ